MSKKALIIGTSRGLGLGLTEEFASRRWNITATARDPHNAPALQQLAAAHATITLEAVDLDRPETLMTLRDRLAGQTFDLLFVNAGIMGPKDQSVDLVTDAEIAQLMMTNAIMPLRLARLFAPQLRAETGVIAFMTSILGSVAEDKTGGMDLYRASKAALNSLTRSFVATELGDRSLTVLSLHPGWVKTDMGGEAAPLDVATSVAGLATVVEQRAGTKSHAFLDYQGHEISW